MPHPAIASMLRAGAAAVVVLLAALFWRDQRRARGALATEALLVGFLCHLLVPLAMTRAPGIVAEPVLLGALATPFLFWLASRSHFEDEYRPSPRSVAALAALYLTRPLARLATAGRLSLPPRGVEALDALAALAALAVLVDALRRIYAGASGDLVLPRLRLRRAVLAAGGAYGAIVVVGDPLVEGSRLEALAATADGLVLLAGALWVGLLALRAEPGLFPSRAAAREPSGPSTALRERLDRLVREERVYREPGLTIGALARRLGEHEYRVRQLINAELGFRNFNAFLNSQRIEDAREALGDPERRDQGIAEIAFSLGYASLGPFNRAFRERTGQTPSDYRRSRLG